MKEDIIISKIKEKFESAIIESSIPAPRRITIKISKDNLFDVVNFLRDNFNFFHLSTITGLDTSTSLSTGNLAEFEILYHFSNELACVTIKIAVLKSNPKVKSICEIIPGAVLYEREIQDMFGITVENIPDSRPLVMPDDWPADNYPLRKDWKFERPPEVIPGEKNNGN